MTPEVVDVTNLLRTVVFHLNDASRDLTSDTMDAKRRSRIGQAAQVCEAVATGLAVDQATTSHFLKSAVSAHRLREPIVPELLSSKITRIGYWLRRAQRSDLSVARRAVVRRWIHGTVQTCFEVDAALVRLAKDRMNLDIAS